MKTNDFIELYNKNVDFKELVDYVCKLAGAWLFIDNIRLAKFDKTLINDIEVENVRGIIAAAGSSVQAEIDKRAREKLLVFIDKLLTKETNAHQANVHERGEDTAH